MSSAWSRSPEGRAWARQYRLDHADTLREKHRAWYGKRREHRLAQAAVYRVANREKIAAREKARRLAIRAQRHGLTEALVATLYDRQGGRCALCLEMHPRSGRSGLVIDHDHATGVRRGLICRPCNIALPAIEKFGLAWAERAVSYLDESALGLAVTFAETLEAA